MSDRFEQKQNLVQGLAGRRSFLQKLASAGTVLAVAGTSANAQTQLPALTDADYLNFLLNLEYLEAEFYTYATTGKGIAFFGFPVSGSGAAADTTGGKAVPFTDLALKAMAAELAVIEQAHMDILRSTLIQLGAPAVAKPAINLNALGAGFGTQAEFLTLARAFEDVGVTAYNGASAFVQSKTVLAVLSRILAMEAEHAGNIRLQIAQAGLTTTALDGVDVAPPPSGTRFFSANDRGLAATRAPGEVLALLYAASNVTSGSFFPAGVNGAINASTVPAPAEGTARTTDSGTLTATPNPITSSNGHGVVTLNWTAVRAQEVEIRSGTINGGLVARGGPTGTVQTGDWVVDKNTFFLQDVTGGKGLFPANTIATVTVRVQPPVVTPAA